MVNKETKALWEDFESWIPGGNNQTVPYVQGELFSNDNELRNKYPALKKAWKQYQVIKKLCLAKEEENEIRK